MDRYTRLQLFYARLQAAPNASTHDESYALLCDTLNSVEDEHSGVPYNPDNFQTDGRLYPPQPDRSYAVDGFPDVVRYRNFGHNTYIAKNGAIEVKVIATNEVDFTKPGANGKGVWE
ncbi:hypothetical protein KBI23_13040 [bacterium]|nr:hypothetical protein [bacterium]MBP9810260.1 hypothetical protein [bacterium]